jgi:polyhydroxyalkanoate synthesis regulator phasin
MCPTVKEGMERLDIYLTKEQARRFREEVFKRLGMKKGNLSSAASEAIVYWINSDEEAVKRKTKGQV